MQETVNFSEGHTHGTKAVGGVNSESQVQSSWSFMLAEIHQTNKYKYSFGYGWGRRRLEKLKTKSKNG